jgi:hypothetical protein
MRLLTSTQNRLFPRLEQTMLNIDMLLLLLSSRSNEKQTDKDTRGLLWSIPQV